MGKDVKSQQEAEGGYCVEIEALRLATVRHRQDGQAGEALQSAGQTVALLRKIGDARGLAAEMCSIAAIHLERGEVEEAAEAGRSAEELFKRLQDKRGEARVLLEIVAPVELRRGEPALAFLAVRSAAALFRALRDASAEGAALEAAAVLQLCGDHAQTMRLAGEARAVYREAQDKCGESRALEVLAHAQLAAGDTDAALSSALQALTLSRTAEDTYQEAQALQALARALLALGAHVEALRAASAALQLCSQAGWRHGEACARRILAEVHVERKEYPPALAEADEAAALFRMLGDHRSLAGTLCLVAKVHFEQKELEESLQDLREAVELHWANGDVPAAAHCLHAAVYVHLKRMAPQAALQAAEEAYVLAEKVGDARTEATALQVLARVHLEPVTEASAEMLQQVPSQHVDANGETAWQRAARRDPLQALPRSATQAAGAACAAFRDMQDRAGLAASLGLLARAHHAKGQPSKALAAAEEARSLQRELQDHAAEAGALLQVAVAHFDAASIPAARGAAEAAAELFGQAGDAERQALEDSFCWGGRPEAGFGWGLGLGSPIAAGGGQRFVKPSQLARDECLEQARRALCPQKGASNVQVDDAAEQGVRAAKSKLGGPPVPFKRRLFPWVLPGKAQDERKREEKDQSEKPVETVVQQAPDGEGGQHAMFAAGAPCERCGVRTDDGAWGWGAFDGQWFCRPCWRRWVDARLHVQRPRRRRASRHREGGPQQGDAQEDEQMLEAALYGKGGAPPGRHAKAAGKGPAAEGAATEGAGAGNSRQFLGKQGGGKGGLRKAGPPAALLVAAGELTSKCKAPPKAAAPIARVGARRPQRGELAGLTLLQLYTRAKELAIDSSLLDAAMDSEDPKASLTELMLTGG